MLKETFLHSKHKELGAKFTEFGGWDMPVQYTSIIEEHNAVRNAVGIFDTSHMGTFIITGSDAGKFLDYVTISDMSNLPLHKARYSMLLNNNGGIKDDIIVYKFENYYMMIVNAGNLSKDFSWLNEHKPATVGIQNMSKDVSMMAVQGPKAVEIISKLTEEDIASMKYFTAKDITFKGQNASFSKIARTGYTGEDGFEIIISNNCAEYMWTKLVELGAKPCGLGCRDTLRLEACMPLHGHEISEEINPIDAGFIKTVFWDKDFIGKQEIEKIKNSPSKKIVAFICKNGIARAHDEVFFNDKKVGYVTSGSFSPTFKKAIGMALIDINIDESSVLQVKVHNNLREINIVPKPFYKRAKK
ncbi:MAG: glycine cleavage system aminomethyltransferase GcvT [Elusimicrobia bacterium]|nr:glycine cleavage system aminomethyltransferase GcvT [Elusimicrobiota bacterium]